MNNAWEKKLDEILKISQENRQASLKSYVQNQPGNFTRFGKISIATVPENPIPLPGPFKTFFWASASVQTDVVFLVLNSLSGGQIDAAIPIKPNQVVNFDNPIAHAWLVWGANDWINLGETVSRVNSGTATFYLGLDAEIETNTVSTSQSSLAVSQLDGKTFTTLVSPAQVTSTASKILDLSAYTLVKCPTHTITNHGPNTIYIGDSTVVTGPAIAAGTKYGHPILKDERFVYKNLADLWAVCAATETAYLSASVESF